MNSRTVLKDSPVRIATRLQDGPAGVTVPAGKDILLSSETFSSAVGAKFPRGQNGQDVVKTTLASFDNQS